MSWFGRFCLGALTGAVLSTVVAVGVVYVAESGGLVAVNAQLQQALRDAKSSWRDDKTAAASDPDPDPVDTPVRATPKAGDTAKLPTLAAAAPVGDPATPGANDATSLVEEMKSAIDKMDFSGRQMAAAEPGDDTADDIAKGILERQMANVRPMVEGLQASGLPVAGSNPAVGAQQMAALQQLLSAQGAGGVGGVGGALPQDLVKLGEVLGKIDMSDRNPGRAGEVARAMNVDPSVMKVYFQMMDASEKGGLNDAAVSHQLNQMSSLQALPGETPQQTIERALTPIMPLLQNGVAGANQDSSGLGDFRRAVLGQLIKSACGKAGPALSARECAVVESLASGGGPMAGSALPKARRLAAPTPDVDALKVNRTPAKERVDIGPATPRVLADPKSLLAPVPRARPAEPKRVLSKREKRWIRICDPKRIATLNAGQKAAVTSICAERKRRVAAGED